MTTTEDKLRDYLKRVTTELHQTHGKLRDLVTVRPGLTEDENRILQEASQRARNRRSDRI